MYLTPDLQQLKYDIYLRRSSDDTDHQTASLPSQKEVLTRLQKEYSLSVLEVHEESKSAKQPGRSVFNQVIERIEKGIVQGLIVWDLSRLSRNPVDAGTLSWVLQQNILKVIVTPHRIYLPQDNVLLMNIEFGQANQTIRDLSVNVKRGLNTKLQNGQRPGIAPEGYLNDNSHGKGQARITVDEVRFTLVRKMWDLLLTGCYSVPQILTIANDEWGFKTKKHKELGGNKLSRAALYRIFTNPFYYGWYEYGGNWYLGKHIAMITEEEYDKAQRLLGRKGKQRPKLRTFSFTGMITCGECGARVTAEEKVNKYGTHYTYYHCTKRKNPNCKQKAIERTALEQQIDAVLQKIEIDDTFKDWAIEYLNELHDQESKEQVAVNHNIDQTYQDCLKKMSNLVKLKISPQNSNGDILSDEDFEKEMLPLKKEKARLVQQKNNLDQRVNKWLELSQKTFRFACYARYWFHNGSLQQKKEILQTLGSNFLLYEKKLSLDVLKPFVIIKKSKNEVDAICSKLELQEKTDRTAQLQYLYAQNTSLRRE